jgi:Predicted nucleotide-binding protein containing TIR-like domain
MKPRLFIGSSSENLNVAYAVQQGLEAVAEVTVWTQGVFSPSKYNLESLVDALFETDFGVFVFSPDDQATIRGGTFETVRDNVIFELGMFVGRLGRERSFILTPRQGMENLHLPSDLLGLTPAMYDGNRRDNNWVAAVGPACSSISQSIVRLGILSTQVANHRVVEALAPEIRAPQITDDERKVLKALVAGSTPIRSVLGISKESTLSKGEINGLLTSLIKKGLVQQVVNSAGQPRWTANEAGRLLADG